MKDSEKYETSKKASTKLLKGIQITHHTYYWELIKRCQLLKIRKESLRKLIKKDAVAEHHELIDKMINRIYDPKLNQIRTNFQLVVEFLKEKVLRQTFGTLISNLLVKGAH